MHKTNTYATCKEHADCRDCIHNRLREECDNCNGSGFISDGYENWKCNHCDVDHYIDSVLRKVRDDAYDDCELICRSVYATKENQYGRPRELTAIEIADKIRELKGAK